MTIRSAMIMNDMKLQVYVYNCHTIDKRICAFRHLCIDVLYAWDGMKGIFAWPNKPHYRIKSLVFLLGQYKDKTALFVEFKDNLVVLVDIWGFEKSLYTRIATWTRSL